MPEMQASIAPDYLHEADLTVRYVDSAMTLGASNRAGDVISTLGDSASCVYNMREELKQEGINSLPTSEILVKRAVAALANGCGNCGEQSAIAFMYLYNKGIRPVEWMRFTDRDHAFVVIGRAWKASFDWDVPNWGNFAVVCDPWKKKAYRAIELKSVWPGGTPTVWYRVS